MLSSKDSFSEKRQKQSTWLKPRSSLSCGTPTYQLPYLVTYPMWAKVLIISGPAIMLYILLFDFQVVVRFWIEHNWVVRLLLLAVYLVVIPGGVLTAVLVRTTFDTVGIVHCSALGVTTSKSYTDVVSFQFVKGKVLTICFADGSNLKVWAATADLFKVMQIIKDQAKKPMPTKPSSRP